MRGVNGVNLIEVYRGFWSEAIALGYPASARVLFDTVMYKLNEAYWAAEVMLSERELMRMSQLPKTTLHEAKEYLKAVGMLTVRVAGRRSYYGLGAAIMAKMGYLEVDRASTGTFEKVDMQSSNRPITDHQPTINRPITDHQPTELENSNITRAREYREIDIYNKGESAHEIFSTWEAEIGRPSPADKRKLLELLKTHSVDNVKAAIEDTHARYRYPTFERFLGVLKGGENHESENTARVDRVYRQSRSGRGRAKTPAEPRPRNDGKPRYTEEPDYSWLDEAVDNLAATETVTEPVSEVVEVGEVPEVGEGITVAEYESAHQRGVGRVPELRRDDVPESDNALEDADSLNVQRRAVVGARAVPIRGSTGDASTVAFVANSEPILGQNACRLSRRRR